MTPHVDNGLLQDFQEGLLPPELEEQVRRHLAVCSRCREELESLADLLEGMAGLPREIQPSRDLWPQIGWRISRKGRGRRWRIDLTAWQLVAAGLVVAVISGGAVWAFLSGGGGGPVPSTAPPAWMAQSAGWQEAYEGYDEAVSDLEAVMELGRHALDPETVRILEENLATIDRAIQDAREALAADPGSVVVRRILAESLRWKVSLLRHAVSAVYANT